MERDQVVLFKINLIVSSWTFLTGAYILKQSGWFFFCLQVRKGKRVWHRHILEKD